MKTTLNLPDDLMRTVKMRALLENKTLQATIAELLRRGLGEAGPVPSPSARVQLPLVECVHEATPGYELTPERAAQALEDQEALDSLRY